MTRYLGIPLLVIAAILQGSIVPEIRIGEAGPDLVLLLVLSWGLLAGYEDALLWAVVGGILSDLVGGTPTGISALGMVVAVFLMNAIMGTVSRNNVIFPPLAAAIGTVVMHLVVLVTLRLIGREVAFFYALTNITLPGALYNVILVLPIFRIVGTVYEVYRPRRVSL